MQIRRFPLKSSYLLCFSILFTLSSISVGFTEEPVLRSAGVPTLGEAPQQVGEVTEYLVLRQAAPALAEWETLTEDRQLSRAFYNIVYLSSEGTMAGWVGDVGNCAAGDTSAEFKEAVLTRVNYYRSMGGVPPTILFDATYNSKSQKAALIMSSNNALDHTPPATWSCYTTEGAEAAGKSNLSLGSYGWEAIDGQMRDNGSGNTAAGHRRWILYPSTTLMGTGDIPPESGSRPANSLWVISPTGPRPATRDPYVAWPPPGFVPYQIVPARWSFSYPGADFLSATVSMTSQGSGVPVSVHPVQSGYADNTIVWVADNLDATLWNASWPVPSQDTTYTVTVGNVMINGVATSFTYDVTVIDPAERGVAEQFATLNGDGEVELNEPGDYSYTSLSFAGSYEVLAASLVSGEFFEGAENGLSGVLDGTSSGYSALSSDFYSGANAFHLSHPNGQTQLQSVELDTTFVASGSSTLQFYSKLGYATSSQTARAQVSTDDGQSWKDIYTQQGQGNSGQSTYEYHELSLSAYDDTMIRVRFAYDFSGGSYYDCIGDHCGFLVDDIRITNSDQVYSATVTDNGSDLSFSFVPAELKPHVLAVRAIPWQGFPGMEWGPLFHVSTVPQQVELEDVIRLLNDLAGGAPTGALEDVVSMLRVLTGQ